MAATAACTTMKTVTPSACATSRTRACTPAGSSSGTRCPWYEATGGRTRSYGSASSSGTPASASRQYATCSASRLPGSSSEPSNRRCHNA
ncbi:hypothetical protein Airi02_030110 [Actinoallomurus iriomotensis]|uniref:Uncharacterized protein n=1 Tax=Actinoallomurus iriomotensis TaxID=478107 RepID=A0A9W6S3R0_9ACTN|nr:hypothetical protein Airi02_030110 [Actinoallomurus iriomotensis]